MWGGEGGHYALKSIKLGTCEAADCIPGEVASNEVRQADLPEPLVQAACNRSKRLSVRGVPTRHQSLLWKDGVLGRHTKV